MKRIIAINGVPMNMKSSNAQTNLIDLVVCLSSSIDLASSDISAHNRQVALVANLIAEQLGFSRSRKMICIMAGLLHDIGALSLKNRSKLHDFDIENIEAHTELGYRHIDHFKPLANVARIVRHHHARWGKKDKMTDQVDELSYLIHLSDRIAVLINRKEEILGQAENIKSKIRSKSGDYFKPEHVDAFMELADKEYFWLSVTCRLSEGKLAETMAPHGETIGDDDLLNFSRMIGRVIDYQSPYTAVHSSRVAAVAESLARHAGLSEEDCFHMKIAGYLHDIGKLAVPPEIINKPSRLTDNEWNIMKSHTFHTYRLLSGIKDFDRITKWASTHHELLNGKGYPFHFLDDELTLAQRIIVISDIFTAITEDRPYRAGMDVDTAIGTLEGMARSGAIDAAVLDILKSRSLELDEVRKAAEAEISRDYSEYISGIDLSAT